MKKNVEMNFMFSFQAFSAVGTKSSSYLESTYPPNFKEVHGKEDTILDSLGIVSRRKSGRETVKIN